MKITKDKINIRSKLAELLNFNQTLERLSDIGVGAGKATNQSNNVLQVAGDMTADNISLNSKASRLKHNGHVRDVYIYDTSMDTDGGVWRDRVTTTSWYNETLNTPTRGSRREFPTVAVIVAQQDTVTIYDGDSPELDMWMVFTGDARGNMIYGLDTKPGEITVKMLNGELCVASNSGDPIGQCGLFIINFIKDAGWMLNESPAGPYIYGGDIKLRNSNKNLTVDQTSYSSLNCQEIWDMDMTVLPNTPVDNITGLPAPTIAVACMYYSAGYDSSVNPSLKASVSVVKADGKVVNIIPETSHHDAPRNACFTKHDELMFTGGNNYDSSDRWTHIMPIPTQDVVIDYASQNNSSIRREPGHRTYSNNWELFLNEDNTTATWAVRNGGLLYTWLETTSSRTRLNINSTKNHLILAGDNRDGLSLIHENTDQYSNGMICHITDYFNTGWLVGNTRHTFADDVSTERIGGDTTTELVSNPYFTSNVDEWLPSNDLGDSTITHSNGALVFARGSSGSAGGVYTKISTTPGTVYNAQVLIDEYPEGGTKVALTCMSRSSLDPERTSGHTIGYALTEGNGQHMLEVDFRAVSTESWIVVAINSTNTTMKITGVTCRQKDNLVHNGNFIGTSQYPDSHGWVVNSYGSLDGQLTKGLEGAAQMYRVDGNNNTVIAQDLGLETGKYYALSFDMINDQHAKITPTAKQLQIRPWHPESGVSGDFYEIVYTCDNGTNTIYFKATLPGIDIRNIGSNGSTVLIKNISVLPCAMNHTAFGRRYRAGYSGEWEMYDGIEVHGEIGKIAVDVDSELQAITGFSTNNFLRKESFMPFGLSDFMISGWLWIYAHESTGQSILNNVHGSDYSNTGTNHWNIGTTNTTGILSLTLYSNGFASNDASRVYLETPNALPVKKWVHFACGRQQDQLVMYIDGKLTGSLDIATQLRQAGRGDTSMNLYQDNGLNVGSYYAGSARERSAYNNTRMCLLHFTHDTVSHEQVSKMFHDESAMFKPGAKVTLSHDGVINTHGDDHSDKFHTCGPDGTDTFLDITRIDSDTPSDLYGNIEHVADSRTIFLTDK